MAPNDSAATDGGTRSAVRRKAARYIVPVAVAGTAAATIGLVPALASTGDPDLPKISAQRLIEKIAASDTQQLSGTVKISTDLGLPSLGGLAGSLAQDGGSGGSSADPQQKLTELASGTHTLRVAADGPDRQRLSVLEDAAEYSLIHNGDEVWAYDSGSNQAYHAKERQASGGHGTAGEHGRTAPFAGSAPTTPKEFAEQFLKAADPTTSVSVDGTARIAGRDAYRLVVKPKLSGSTVASVTVAVDAKNGVPLKFTLLPSGGGKAVVDAGFTQVDFGKPAASSFTFTPPKGAQVTEADDAKAGRKADGPQGFGLFPGIGEPGAGAEGAKGAKDAKDAGDLKVIGEGWNAIAEISVPGGTGLASKASGEDVPAEARQFLDALGDRVSGTFGSGMVFKTRLINALMTDDGKVYVGAVTPDTLVKAADSAS
ncbi:LolA family protein [Streptomyces sp. PTD5-9]|uniref:LolA family protein n=1 Tax=Streptomyces sp. PTD5-9 TaxID=3120150 RepID=UPI003009DDBA